MPFVLWSLNALAQDGDALQPVDSAPAPAGPKLDVKDGPLEGQLGTIASISVPVGYGFVDQSQMPVLNKLTGNPDNAKDVGAVLADSGWIVFFTWDPIGYVKDDERDDLDAEEMLKTMQESQVEANKERVRLGFNSLTIERWHKPPYYDLKTNNLTWALINKLGTSEERNVNHEVRILGRGGVMSATLVASPDQMETATVELDKMIAGFKFNDGQRYSQYLPGDKVAEYGLTGLVVGGGILAAAKTGLLAKLGKFIKVIVVGAIALIAGLMKKLSGRKTDGDQAET